MACAITCAITCATSPLPYAAADLFNHALGKQIVQWFTQGEMVYTVARDYFVRFINKEEDPVATIKFAALLATITRHLACATQGLIISTDARLVVFCVEHATALVSSCDPSIRLSEWDPVLTEMIARGGVTDTDREGKQGLMQLSHMIHDQVLFEIGYMIMRDVDLHRNARDQLFAFIDESDEIFDETQRVGYLWEANRLLGLLLMQWANGTRKLKDYAVNNHGAMLKKIEDMEVKLGGLSITAADVTSRIAAAEMVLDLSHDAAGQNKKKGTPTHKDMVRVENLLGKLATRCNSIESKHDEFTLALTRLAEISAREADVHGDDINELQRRIEKRLAKAVKERVALQLQEKMDDMIMRMEQTVEERVEAAMEAMRGEMAEGPVKTLDAAIAQKWSEFNALVSRQVYVVKGALDTMVKDTNAWRENMTAKLEAATKGDERRRKVQQSGTDGGEDANVVAVLNGMARMAETVGSLSGKVVGLQNDLVTLKHNVSMAWQVQHANAWNIMQTIPLMR
jgi:predicted secreted Zn-dependent protease